MDKNSREYFQSATCGYEYDNIQAELNRMTDTQLQSDRAHRLMDRAAIIRSAWRD